MSDNPMKTYAARPSDVKRKWYIIDATDLVLGRLASITALYLRGKHKAMFSPNIDCGDNIVIINADKICLTGKKTDQKTYYWHTGHPGGIKSRTAKDLLTGQFPERVLRKAIETMISRNPMGRQQLKKLYIYAGSEHPHSAQKPEVLDIASMNRKNKKN